MTVLRLIVIMLKQCCVIYFGFLHIHQRNNLKLVWNCCNDFEQVYGGCLISYILNCMSESQFEIKDTFIEFVINNVSP